MSTEIINGKLHTNNIYTAKLIILFIFLLTHPDPISALNNEKGWTIVIDAGHGGKDPGAKGSFSWEKDINLAIALKTGQYIKQNIKDVTVIYTRKDDSRINLIDRPKIANKANADLFISIHTNWAESKKVMGAETYIMGPAKDQANLEVAMKENAVMLREDDYSTKKYDGFDPTSPESYIQFSLTQKVFHEQSTGLASKVQTEFRERVNRNDRDVKQAGFWVLYNTKMPSILIETGFITNPAEEKYLNSQEGQDYIASAIFRACRDYLDEIDSKSSSYQFKEENSEQISEKQPEQKQEMKTDLPKPVISSDEKIVFMIQIATSSSKTEVRPENFNGLKDVIELKTEERYRYLSGNFKDYPSAAIYREKLESVYPGAFVIAVKNNKILPLQQAFEQNKQK
jgi:N-acetylmuramoyl-L-alanine amidase